MDEINFKKLKNLACLHLDEQEELSLLEDVKKILEYVDMVKNAETNEVPPLFHPFDLHQRFRPDTDLEQDCLAQLGALSADFQENCYLVPLVIEQGDS